MQNTSRAPEIRLVSSHVGLSVALKLGLPIVLRGQSGLVIVEWQLSNI